MIGTMLVAFIALVITLYVGVAVAPVLDGRDYSAFRHAG
jgi:ABC-type phosphate transport system permease subunit